MSEDLLANILSFIMIGKSLAGFFFGYSKMLRQAGDIVIGDRDT